MVTILLVENDVQDREMRRSGLQRWGYQVLLAHDGAQGLAATAQCDLIVMDINMPVLDGLDATTRLKAAPATQAIPILVLTANALAGDRGQTLAAGTDEYEPKPVDFARLRQKIANLLAASSPLPPAEEL
jgi:CheY-like chemotaxis protein